MVELEIVAADYGSASTLMKNLNEPVCWTPNRNCKLMLCPGARGVGSVIVGVFFHRLFPWIADLDMCVMD